MSKTILEMNNITKIYPNGVVANKNVDFEVKKGEIHALMGENGAGKSTLVKILFGLEQAEEGEIYLNQELVNISSPLKAIELGIGMVHQHFMLVEHLTVMENIILGMEPRKRLSIDEEKAYEMVSKVNEKYQFGLNPHKKISELNVSQRQKVEILKVLIRGAKILIMDEPTAVLTPQETEELFVQLKSLKDSGHTIIFISHKLKEIKALCDRMTIMRNAKYVGTYDVDDVSTEDISRLMIGRDVILEIEKDKATITDEALRVQDIRVVKEDGKEHVKNVSFQVRKGEILGIAAIEGNGQRELLDAITGLNLPTTGDVFINGSKCEDDQAIRNRREKGLAHIPEDRLIYGTMIDESIQDNLIANRFNRKDFNQGIFLNMKKIEELSDKLIKEFQIKTDSPYTPVKMLSGGNIQKVVAAREMSSSMTVLVADQPTRGIDVGTANFIHKTLIDLRDSGVAIILSSADINEVLEISDSLIVMYDGQITAYFKNASDLDENTLGLYMLGIRQMEHDEIRRAIYDVKA